MLQYDSNKAIISIHIPKAGGTSFRKILSNWYGNKLHLHYFNENNKLMPEKFELLPGMCIHGHFNSSRDFGIRHYYPEADQFITFMRDPFDIIVSRYYYVKMREKAGTSYRDGKPTNLADNVNDFLEQEIHNSNYTPNILDFFPEVITSENYEQIIRSKFIYIGFMDNYQESVDRLADILGFPHMIAPFENKSERFGEIDPSLRKIFMETHQLEYKVYNCARKIFF
ncbi:MAG: sulfotransferase family 2 domain-containing protein [Bacteroidales bacterium]